MPSGGFVIDEIGPRSDRAAGRDRRSAVRFLVGPDASFVNGSAFVVDGGMLAKLAIGRDRAAGRLLAQTVAPPTSGTLRRAPAISQRRRGPDDGPDHHPCTLCRGLCSASADERRPTPAPADAAERTLMANLKDVAKLAGYDPSTVSRVLSDAEYGPLRPRRGNGSCPQRRSSTTGPTASREACGPSGPARSRCSFPSSTTRASREVTHGVQRSCPGGRLSA